MLQFDLLAQLLAYEPLRTIDTDVAVPPHLPATSEQIRERQLEKVQKILIPDT